MRLRSLTVVTVLALAATGLTACSSKVGQAAVVGGHRISQKDVTRYVVPSAPQATAAAGQTATPPKVFILDTLIQSDLFAAALKASPGGMPSESAIAAAHDNAAMTIIGAPIGGAEFDKEYTQQFTKLGYRAAFEPVVVRAVELEYLLVVRTKAKALADLVTAVDKLHINVSVAGRYGVWKPSGLEINSADGAGLPSYVKFNSTAPAS